MHDPHPMHELHPMHAPDPKRGPGPSTSTPDLPSQRTKSAALVGRRLLALCYDAFPVVALWLLLSALFTAAFTLAGHGGRETIAPFSALQLVLWLACWLVTGAYAVLSWRRGGQTLGMRPWRLQVVAADGGPASTRAACVRFGVGTLSLLAGGLGFWWAWLDREKLAWHDRASDTRIERIAKKPAA